MSKAPQLYMQADWFAGLMKEVRLSSKQAVATKLGLSRTTISLVCSGGGLYGSGKASTKHVEKAYRRVFEQLECPHTGKAVGINHCRSLALRPAPSHNPIQMINWQACQKCEHKPFPEATGAEKDATPAPKRKSRKEHRQGAQEVPQQAGIIDKVTMPLPVVGGPQVNQEHTSVEAV